MAERRKFRRPADEVDLDEELDEEPTEDELEDQADDEDEAELEAEDRPELADESEPEPAARDEHSANGRGTRSRRPVRRYQRSASTGTSALTAGEAAKAALRQIVELTAKPAESITGVQRIEDGWLIGVEVVEDRRIPSSTDILATYETTIDADGELMSYQRVRRYPRGRGDSNGEP
jgi:Gas vesicle synthesis protein GvpO